MSKNQDGEKYLIINADDFGMCHAANQAVINLFNDKLITSASIMPVCPWFMEAAVYAAEKRADVGAHLTFTSEWKSYRWRSLSGAGSLNDKDGYMPRTCPEFEQKADRAEVLKEIQRQLDVFSDNNVEITNIDNHMGSLYGLNSGKSFIPDILDICSEKKLPFRFPRFFPSEREKALPEEVLKDCRKIVDLAEEKGVALIDYLIEYPFHLTPDENYESYKRMIIGLLRQLSSGISELYIHPAVECEEIQAVNPSWEKRVMEYRVLYEDQVQNVISAEGIRLIPWSEVGRCRE